MFRARPVVSASLGLGLVLSVAALFCLLGVFALPWLGCELYALQVAIATKERVPRRRAWVSAGLFILASAALVVGASVIAAIGFDFASEDPLTDARHVALAALGVALALLFVVPFTYAPQILVDRGGTLGAAVLESTRFVVRDGVVPHIGLVLVAHFVQTAPLLIAAFLGLLFVDASVVPLMLVVAVPFLAVTVPVGQGAITAAWVARRSRLTTAELRRPAGRPPSWLTAVLGLSWATPGLSLMLVLGALLSPSPLALVTGAPEGERVLDVTPADGPREFAIPDTALTLIVDAAGLSIVASDGGGAGRLPLAGGGPVQRVRVSRARDSYLIDVRTSAGVRRAIVDRAGVRRDDGLIRRLDARVSPLGMLVLALALLLTPLVATRALLAVAELRAASARPASDVSDGALEAHRRRALGTAARLLFALAPLSLGALAVGILALL